MQGDGYPKASANKHLLSNKQVIAIFVLGIVMLFVAFWAGLSVIKGGIVSSSNQATQKGANLPSQRPPEPQRQSDAVAANATPPSAQSMSADAGEGRRYTVRVAAFGTQEAAEQVKTELKKKNYISAYVQTPSGQDTLYYVNVGPFNKREDAQQVANDLSIEGKKVLGIFQSANN